MGDNFARELAIESWSLYVLGIFIIVCRLISRKIVKKSWKKLQADDYMMVLIALSFTGVIVCVNETAVNGSNYLPPGEAEKLTEEGVATAIWGSKMTFALEHFTLTSVWGAKACILFIYGRLTLGLKQNLAVKLMAGYIVISFILVEVLFCAAWCGPPITMYWDVPVVQSQCATYYNHMIITTTFNVSSDLMMIAIPLPVLIKAQLPLKRKLLLCGVFSLGVFVILMAILNRYYNFSKAFNPIFLKWYVGEVATAIYVANLPLLWPLLKKVFKLHTFTGKSHSDSGALSGSRHLDQSRSRNKIHMRSTIRQASSTDSIVRCTDREVSNTRSADDSPPPSYMHNPSNVEAGLELRHLDDRENYKATITSGQHKDSFDDGAYTHDGIFRTVQVTQYRT